MEPTMAGETILGVGLFVGILVVVGVLWAGDGEAVWMRAVWTVRGWRWHVVTTHRPITCVRQPEISYLDHDLTAEVEAWCRENLTGAYRCAPTFGSSTDLITLFLAIRKSEPARRSVWFRRADDALLFKLRWC